MKFLEKNLEDIIFGTDNSLLQERGLPIYGKKYRQFTLGNYGRADLITVQKQRWIIGSSLHFTIFELKEGNIDNSAIIQSFRYLKGVQQYIEHKFNRGCEGYDYSIVVIGSGVAANSDLLYLPELIRFENSEFSLEGGTFSLFTYSYEFDGIKFHEASGYKLINEGF